MKKPVQILLVEDNEGDVVLAQEALKEGNIETKVDVVRDGQEALDYLHKQKRYAKAETPDLILLDINLPRIDGKEVLANIKHDQNLRLIPVIMLTTSSSHKDVLDSYYHHANCYITKPVDLDKFLTVVQKIENFWLSIVKLPDKKLSF